MCRRIFCETRSRIKLIHDPFMTPIPYILWDTLKPLCLRSFFCGGTSYITQGTSLSIYTSRFHGSPFHATQGGDIRKYSFIEYFQISYKAFWKFFLDDLSLSKINYTLLSLQIIFSLPLRAPRTMVLGGVLNILRKRNKIRRENGKG